MSEVSVDDVDQ